MKFNELDKVDVLSKSHAFNVGIVFLHWCNMEIGSYCSRELDADI